MLSLTLILTEKNPKKLIYEWISALTLLNAKNISCMKKRKKVNLY